MTFTQRISNALATRPGPMSSIVRSATDYAASIAARPVDAASRFLSRGRTAPEDPRRYLTMLPMPQVVSGIPLTMDMALQVSVVWACIDAITKAVSCSPWKVLGIDGRKRTYLPDDPMDYLLNERPNPELTGIAFRESMLYQATTWGNSYAEIVKDSRGRVTELWPLLSDRMVPIRDAETGRLIYGYAELTGNWVFLEADQVFHMRGPTINGLIGENMIAHAARSIGLNMAAERFASSYYSNNTIVGAVLEYPKTLSNEAYERLKRDWEEKRQGPDKAHKPLILEGGMKFNAITNDSSKSQQVESRKFSVEDICRWWGVPPHKVQHLDRATFANIEHLGIEFTRDAVTPWALRLTQEANYKLFPPRAPYRTTRIDTSWLMHGDAKSRSEANATYRRIGVYNANDIREKEGENTIDGPDGETYLVESNMTTVDLLLNPPAPPTPSLPPGAGKEKNPAEHEDDAGKGQEAPPPAKKDAGALVRDAAVTLFASVFDRYSKRLEARERDLRRPANVTEQKVQSHMAETRIELRDWVVEQSDRAMALVSQMIGTKMEDAAVLVALESVDNGVLPEAAAERLVASMTQE